MAEMKPHEIKASLVLKKVTQAQIAKELGITRMTVNGVICGRSKSKRVQEKIAQILEKPLEEIWP